MKQAYEEDFYQKLRIKINEWLKSEDGSKNKWAKYLIWAPDLFHLICRLSIDKEVPPKEKTKLIVAIAYFISPIDLLPEAVLGPVGYIDDIAVVAYVLNSMINNIGSDIIQKHWVGEDDVLEVIKHILDVADEMVGSGLWARLKEMFK
jgi:uncharacterized membrane protein YkvA (DUF1232 family)